jgi:Ran GTPase-activating protein (RanGAP) involved in mRNA processing and transport
LGGLEGLTNLLEIGLSDNIIGDEGAKYLADGIKLNSTLLEIILAGNWIGADLKSQIAQSLNENI